VETSIARALLSGDVQDGATIHVDAKGDELMVSFENPAPGREVGA
jgi:ATP-dependent Clp protease ATP-binding subunit ClpB